MEEKRDGNLIGIIDEVGAAKAAALGFADILATYEQAHDAPSGETIATISNGLFDLADKLAHVSEELDAAADNAGMTWDEGNALAAALGMTPSEFEKITDKAGITSRGDGN